MSIRCDMDLLEQQRAMRARVAQAFNVPEVRLVGRSRKREIAHARHIAVYCIRKRWPRTSYPQIARLLGGRDHSTIINSYRMAEGMIERDRHLRAMVDHLVTAIVSIQQDAHVAQWRHFRASVDQSGGPSLEDVMAACAHAFDVGQEQIKGRSRTAKVARARSSTLYILHRRFPKASYRQIGLIAGGLNHSSVIRAIKVCEMRVSNDPVYAGVVNRLVKGELAPASDLQPRDLRRVKPKNALDPDDFDALKRRSGSDALSLAIAAAGGWR